MEECLVPTHRNQHFQWLGATTEMPKMRKVELRNNIERTPFGAAGVEETHHTVESLFLALQGSAAGRQARSRPF